MRAQREMIEDKVNGRHIETVSSDLPDLKGVPPKPRPSGPLGQQSDVYYSDPNTGKTTHQWISDPDLIRWGYWKKL